MGATAGPTTLAVQCQPGAVVVSYGAGTNRRRQQYTVQAGSSPASTAASSALVSLSSCQEQ